MRSTKDERDYVSESLIEGLCVGDVDDGRAGGDRDGYESVVAMQARGDEGAVICDAPCGIVAEVENDVFGCCGVQGEVSGSGAGLGAGGGFGVGVGGEPVGGVGVGEGVVVGGSGGVLVGGVGALIGMEEGETGFDGVFFVAGLVEEDVGRIGEGCSYDDCEDSCEFGFEVDWFESEGDCQSEDCGEDGQETPGELQEGEFGGVVPDDCG